MLRQHEPWHSIDMQTLMSITREMQAYKLTFRSAGDLGTGRPAHMLRLRCVIAPSQFCSFPSTPAFPPLSPAFLSRRFLGGERRQPEFLGGLF
jgi:hypothetical protein